LLRDQGTLAGRVLNSLDVSLEHVRAQVGLIVGQGDESTTGQIPFTPRAKKVLELSLRESQRLRDNHIDTEHLLLGVMRENEGVASRILLDFDVDAEKVRARVAEARSGGRTYAPKPYQPASPPVSAEVGDELERLQSELEAAIEAQEFERAAGLRERHRLLLGTAKNLEMVWQRRSRGHESTSPSGEPVGSAAAVRFGRFGSGMPWQITNYSPSRTPSLETAVWFALGAVVLGAGLLLGWLIWG
jgi:hypothetical protein